MITIPFHPEKPHKKKIYHELHEQKRVVKFLREQELFGRVVKFTATAQSTYTGYAEQARLSASGVERGLPDLIMILQPDQKKSVLCFIEMKRPRKILKNGKMGASPSTVGIEQLEWINALNNLGTPVIATIAYGSDEAIKTITSLLGDVSPPIKTQSERDQSFAEFTSFVNGKTPKV